MLAAGAKANALGIPVILDPVGAGATQFRTTANKRLLERLRISVLKGILEIRSSSQYWKRKCSLLSHTTQKRYLYVWLLSFQKGNVGEIGALAGEQVVVRGVESVGGVNDPSATVAKLARERCTVVAATGQRDFISGPPCSLSLSQVTKACTIISLFSLSFFSQSPWHTYAKAFDKPAPLSINLSALSALSLSLSLLSYPAPHTVTHTTHRHTQVPKKIHFSSLSLWLEPITGH